MQQQDVEAAAKVLMEAKATKRHQRLLETLGPARNAIETILDIGKAVAEVSGRGWRLNLF
jgi:hypothetical protein